MRTKSNPTWPTKKHPDFFTGESAVGVADEDLEQFEAEQQAAIEAELEELEAEFEQLVDAALPRLKGYSEDPRGDIDEGWFEDYFEESLRYGTAAEECMAKLEQEESIAQVLEELRARGVEERSLLEFFKRTDFYEPESRRRRGEKIEVWSMRLEGEDEQSWADLSEWMDLAGIEYFIAKLADEWTSETTQTFLDKLEKIIERQTYLTIRQSNGSLEGGKAAIKTLRSWRIYARYDHGIVSVVADPDSVVEALQSEFEDVLEIEVVRYGPEPQPQVAYTYSGTNDTIAGASGRGLYVAKLTPRDLAAESRALGHCIGSEANGHPKALREGKTMVFSIRTESGKPKFTIELKKTLGDGVEIDGATWKVAEVKGKANRLAGFEPGKTTFTKMDDLRLVTDFLTYLGFTPEELRSFGDVAPGIRAAEEQGIDPFAPPPKRSRHIRENPEVGYTSPAVRALLRRTKPMGNFR